MSKHPPRRTFYTVDGRMYEIMGHSDSKDGPGYSLYQVAKGTGKGNDMVTVRIPVARLLRETAERIAKFILEEGGQDGS